MTTIRFVLAGLEARLAVTPKPTSKSAFGGCLDCAMSMDWHSCLCLYHRTVNSRDYLLRCEAHGTEPVFFGLEDLLPKTWPAQGFDDIPF